MRPRPTIPFLLAVAGLLLHVVVNILTPYGVHRDEFLYMAMGRHLQLWRMDFPPLIAIASELSRLGGDSLAEIRIIPAIAAAALIALAAHIARLFGGGARAAWLSSLAVLASPLFLRTGNLLQPVILDQLWWTLALLAFAHVGIGRSTNASRGLPRLVVDERYGWLSLGAALGLGLLTKFSILILAVAIAVAILATPIRRSLATPWPWVAVVLTLAIGSPSIVGQLMLHYPVLGQMHDLRTTQLQRTTPGEFLAGQLLLGPAFVLAATGVVALIFAARFRAVRAVGVACAAAFVLLLLLHGKSYYIGPIYVTLFAAGAAVIEQVSATDRWPRFVLPAAAVLVAGYGALTLPFGVPILAPARMAAFAKRMGARSAVRTNTGEVESLPQDYADMLGWPEQTEAVARVVHSLSPAERAQLVIAAGNYGEAGALDFYGPRVGLPRVISSAGSFWFFGPGSRSGEITVVLANRAAENDLAKEFRVVSIADSVVTADRRWLVREERDVVVFRCTGPRESLQQLWPELAGRN